MMDLHLKMATKQKSQGFEYETSVETWFVDCLSFVKVLSQAS